MAVEEQPLAGRVALVTGGGRGIGRGIALALAEDGARVAVNWRSDEAAANETINQIKELGGEARAYRASVDDAVAVEEMAEAVLADFGGADIVVNNAGIASRGDSMLDTRAGEVERLMQVHAFGPYYVTRAFLGAMRTRPRGDLIFISSAATDRWPARSGPYNMAKAAMEALAFTLAREERRHGIRVNIVAPGLTESDMGDRLARAKAGVGDLSQLADRSPFGRVGTPDDIAGAVRWLVSERASYVTGQRIYVHGGAT